MSSNALTLSELIALIQPDFRALADGERRMTDVWYDRPTDSLPILFGAQVTEPLLDTATIGDERERMLYEWAIGLLAKSRAGSDAQLGIRANTGTGTLATIAGCRLLPAENNLPWTLHLSHEEMEAFSPERIDFAAAGVMPRVRELYDYFRAQLPRSVRMFCADTQGPFDLAHLLYGNDIFYAVYDEPAFIHELLEKATRLYIDGTILMKRWIDEPLDGGCHFDMALANGGVRACEDSSTLLSPDLIDEFVLPYQQRALSAFSGGFIHFCGTNPALYRGVLANPAVRGLNLGNPERYDFGAVIADCLAAGKSYAGTVWRHEGEALDAYFRRVIGYTQGAGKGLILTPILLPEETADPRRVLDVWRSMQ